MTIRTRVLALYPLCPCFTMTTMAFVFIGDPFVNVYMGLGDLPIVLMRYHENISMCTNR